VSDNVLNQQCVEFHNGINQGVDNNAVSITKACTVSSACDLSSKLIMDTSVNHGSCIEGVYSDDLEGTLPPYSIAGDCDLEKSFDDELFCKQFSRSNGMNNCNEFCFCDHSVDLNKCVHIDCVTDPSPLLSSDILVDVNVNIYFDGIQNSNELEFDNFYSGYAINELDFGVNDILCILKFKKLSNCVNNCSICSDLFSNNVHQFQHLFGYLNLGPQVISSNVPGPYN
jgi:hypothetical protein